MLPEGALPVTEINASQNADWPIDILTLLESGRVGDLQAWLYSLEASGVKDLKGREIPPDRVEYGPLYRRPRKVWGIGLNYAEHAEDLSEKRPGGRAGQLHAPRHDHCRSGR